MRPERIVLLRSGRHLQRALRALRDFAPECEVIVVGTPGSEQALQQAGIPPERTLIYSKQARFTPLAFAFSATGLALRGRRVDRVAVLWNDPAGTGQGNVDRTALALDPRGFLAITPDGRVIERRLWPQLRRELGRTVASLAALLALAALYIPAWLVPGRR
jgi:hypothetical protein